MKWRWRNKGALGRYGGGKGTNRHLLYHPTRRPSNFSDMLAPTVITGFLHYPPTNSTETRSSATAEVPRDELCKSKSCQLLHNCAWEHVVSLEQIHSKSIMDLEHDATTVVSVINKLDRRRVLLTTRSTCHFRSPEFWIKLQMGVLLFSSIPKFPYDTVYEKCGRKHPYQKPLDSFSRFDRIQECDNESIYRVAH